MADQQISSASASGKRFPFSGGLARKREVSEAETGWQTVGRRPGAEKRLLCDLNKLPPKFKFLESAETYPAFLPVDQKCQFPLEAIHGEYRGRDEPTFGSLRMRNPVKIAVFTKDLDKPACVAGHALPQSAQRELDPRIVTMKFIISSQRPSILLEIVLERNTQGLPTKAVQWECFASSLVCSPDKVGFVTECGSIGNEDSVVDNDQQLAGLRGKGELWRTDITLDKSKAKPRFAGLTENELLLMQIDPLTKQQQLICALSKAVRFTAYTQLPEKLHNDLASFKQYIEPLSYVTAHMGLFWYYQLAAPGVSLDNVQYPFSLVAPPRWLVRKFEIVSQGTQPIEAIAVEWAPFEAAAHSLLPTAADQSFEVRLGVAREAAFQEGILEKITESTELQTITANFHSTAKGETYIVSMTLHPKDARAQMPILEIGRRIKISAYNQGRPWKLTGWVIDDILGLGADMSATVTANNPRCPKFVRDEIKEVTVSFPEDFVVTNRAMNAVSRVSQGHQRSEGVDVAEFALCAPRKNGQSTDWLSRYLNAKSHGNRLVRYNNEIKRHGLSTSQEMAAHKVTSHDSIGALNIWGSAGTGKTIGAMALVKALQVAGLKVLVVASSNAAVDNALNTYLSKNPLSQDLDMPQLEEHQRHHRDPTRDALAVCRFSSTLSRTSIRPITAEDEVETSTDVEMSTDLSSLTVGKAKSNWEDEVTQQEDAEETKRRDTAMQAALDMLSEQASNPLARANAQASFSTRKWEHIQSIIARGDSHARNEAQRVKLAAKATKAQEYVTLVETLRGTGKLSKSKYIDVRNRFRELDLEFASDYASRKLKVVFSTLSSAIDELLAEHVKFDAIVCEEAGQSTPAETMIPLAVYKESLKLIIQAGDWKQLKPVVVSNRANEAYRCLELPIFTRNAGLNRVPHVQYDVQYRMHPDIADFPVRKIYEGRIQNDALVRVETEVDRKVVEYMRPLRECNVWNGRHRIFFDVSGKDPRSGTGEVIRSVKYRNGPSSYNPSEASFVADLVVNLIRYGEVDPTRITVLAPYHGQRNHISGLLYGAGLSEGLALRDAMRKVCVLSLDNSQGQENDIVILTMTSNDPDDPNRIGFISNPERLNVGMTRARRFFFAVGNFNGWMSVLLTKDKSQFLNQRQRNVFHDMVDDAFKRRDIISMADFYASVEDPESIRHASFYQNVRPRAPARPTRAHEEELPTSRSFKKSPLDFLEEIRPGERDDATATAAAAGPAGPSHKK